MKHKRRALVCGASQGIGAAVVESLARDGFSVLLLSRSGDKMQQICERLPGDGHQVLVQDLGDLPGLKQKIEMQLQSGTIEVLVNNSGGPKGGPLLAAEPAEFIKALSEHVLVSQNLVQQLVPGMKAQNFGRVINIISTSVKAPIPNLGVSNTIRGAMANWAKTLAHELGAFGITVNNVLPGYTLTPRLQALRKAAAEKQGLSEEQIEKQWKSTIPLARFAEAKEIAEAVAFLASDRASYISGINLPVDGGRTASL